MKEHSDIIEKALEQGYLSFEGDSIIYRTKKLSKQNYTKPEEKVRAEVFARLIIEKEYPRSHIAIEVPVKMGSENTSNKRADIVVYKNAKHQKAFIVVELKKSSQKDLRETLKQALSYAGSGSLRADYALATNGKEKKGKIFQKFFADFFKGTAGQYFTPLNIVRFMVECFDITQDDLVLDPSCGSGGFLLQTLQYMQEESKKLDGEYDQKRFWHSFAEKNLYGIEINGGISQTAKMNMIIHDDGHTNVITADGLDSFENFIRKNNKFQKNTFNFIFTNPPFGSSIPASKPYFEDFSFAKSEVHFIDKIIDKKSPKDLSTQKSEVLFLERYFEFLKEGGIVACVLPDGILTNSSLQNVRDYLLERFYLLASFSLPQHTFSNYGAGVKSSILVLKKKDKKAMKAFLDKKEAIQNAITQKHKDEILSLRDELKALIAPLQKELKALEKMQNKDLKTQEQIATLKEQIANARETYRYKEELVRDKICAEVSEKLKQLESYEVFMAIIENIGFDATGKELCEYEKSELHTIALEFKKFYQKHWGKNG